MGRRLTVTAAASRWCDLAAGVRVKLRPFTGLTSLAVEAEVATELHAFRKGAGVLQRLGISAREFGALADPNVQLGVGMFLRAVVTGRALIEEWNVEDASGQAAPVTAESIAALFNEPQAGPQVLAAFQTAVEEPLKGQREEGEPSGASPSGSSAEAPDTAEAALRPAPPVPEAGSPGAASPARSKSSRRGRQPAPPRGKRPAAPAPGGSEK
jgi:hypothetical protein